METVPLHGYRPAPGAAIVTSSLTDPASQPSACSMAPRHPGTFPRAPLSPRWPLSGNVLLEEGCPATHSEASPWGALQLQAGVAAHLGPCRSLGHLLAQPFGLQQLRAGPSSLGHRCCPTQSRNKAGHRALSSGRPRQPALQGAAHCLAPAHVRDLCWLEIFLEGAVLFSTSCRISCGNALRCCRTQGRQNRLA